MLSPDQFEAVIPAARLQSEWVPNDGTHRGEAPEKVWARKSAESDERNWNGTHMPGEKPPLSIRESVLRDGFKYPVTVQHPDKAVDGPPRIFDGHHRVAVAADAGLDVPIRYADDNAHAHRLRQADDKAARMARRSR